MALWLAIFLPQLPLEAAWSESSRLLLPPLLAVQQQGRILQCSPAARTAGVRPGLTVSAAQAMAPALLVAHRQEDLEQQHQASVALCLQMFSSQVALPEPHWVVAEIGGSLRLFGGLLALCRKLKANLSGLTLSLRWGVAPSARGACLLAAGAPARQRRALQPNTLRRRLDTLSWKVLPATQPHAPWLQALGIRTLGDLRKLPRAQLQVRTRVELLQVLDQAYGKQIWPLSWWQAPARFCQSFQFDYALEHVHEIVQPASWLIGQMAAWLRMRHEVLEELELHLVHESSRHTQPPTVLRLRLSRPSAAEQAWLRVLAEHLPQQVLSAPVRALRLEAGPGQQAGTPSQALFQEHTSEALDALLDLLRARLGPQGVLQPEFQPDFLPERANAWVPAKPGAVGVLRVSGNSELRRHVARQWPRPVWLLDAPLPLATAQGRPVWQGRLLHLRQGPERLETAWWHGGLQARDYFVADDGQGAYCWIYRQLSGDSAQRGWWLHGWFG